MSGGIKWRKECKNRRGTWLCDRSKWISGWRKFKIREI